MTKQSKNKSSSTSTEMFKEGEITLVECQLTIQTRGRSVITGTVMTSGNPKPDIFKLDIDSVIQDDLLEAIEKVVAPRITRQS